MRTRMRFLGGVLATATVLAACGGDATDKAAQRARRSAGPRSTDAQPLGRTLQLALTRHTPGGTMHRRAFILIVLVLVGTQLFPTVARAEDGVDFHVQVGATSPEAASLPYEYTRFYPDRLRVHRGQTIQFDSLNFHAVSFRPGGERLPAFRLDEGPSGLAVTEDVWQRSPCGDPGRAPCLLDDPSDTLSSGFPLWDLAWRVKIDRPVGTTFTYGCPIHAGMNATIEVVDDAKKLPTQASIDAKTRRQVARDTQEAIRHRAALEADPPHRDEGGRTVWTVLVGASTPSGHISILGYMPRHLHGVRPGDAVEFVSSGPDGHHSVTFPSVLVGDNEISPNNRLTLAALHPACDLDDRTSGLPGVGGPYDPITPLSCPGTLEFMPAPYVADSHPAPANVVATAATYHDSGLMWSEEAPETARGRPAGSGEYFPHRFLAEFPTLGEFSYACTIHGADFMEGTIHVEPELNALLAPT